MQSWKWSHPVRGAWVEIILIKVAIRNIKSHPVRGAWIEIMVLPLLLCLSASRTPHGVRGLKCAGSYGHHVRAESHPSRGAWIEIAEVAVSRALSLSHPIRGMS